MELDARSVQSVARAIEHLSRQEQEELTGLMERIREALNQEDTGVKKVSLQDVSVRTELGPGDIGYVIHRHGALYAREYGYGLQFETYVAKGLCEFVERFDPRTNRVWICEHEARIVGFLLLMNRGEAAQLRYSSSSLNTGGSAWAHGS